MLHEMPLHVGYVLKRFPRLSQTFVLNELRELRRQGVEVTVIARQSPSPDERLPEGVAPFRTVYLDAIGGDPTLLLRRAGVQHLHAHFATWAAGAARRIAGDLGISYSFTAHAHDIYHEQVDRGWLADTIAAARFVATVSEANRAYLEALLDEQARRGTVIRLYNGVNLRDLRPAPAPVPGRIVSVGRLVPKKGLTFLVDACRRLAQEGHPFECLIVGEGEERGRLEAQIAESGLAGTVALLGARSHEDTLALLRSAAICVLPCVIAPDGDRDGLPTVLLEALALGVPVVSTTLPGVPEIVEDGVSGLLAEPGDAPALAVRLAALLWSPSLADRLRAGGLRKVQADFDLSTNVARLRNLFQRAVDARLTSHEGTPRPAFHRARPGR